MNSKKYELTDETITVNGHKLCRIRALVGFDLARGRVTINPGDLGGFVERETNLSHSGKCWISGNARVFNDAQIYGDAWVTGIARVFGNARIYGSANIEHYALVHDNARVYGNAIVRYDAEVYGNAQVYGNAKVLGDGSVYGDMCICGNDVIGTVCFLF